MRTLKFNKFERIAGLFLFGAILGTAVVGISAAIRQGWFETKIDYYTLFENGDGIHAGTTVQIAGLRAGAVDEVELQSDNKIKVNFYVLGKFHDKIREDSHAILVRPFVIGDRVLEITVGKPELAIRQEKAEIPSEESVDIMTVMSGKKLGVYLGQMSEMVSNLRVLMQAFLNKDRTESMVRIFDKVDPLLGNLNAMSLEVTKLSKQATGNENMRKVMENVAVMSQELNKILPELNRENPDMAKHIALLTKNLAGFSQAVKAVGPEIPGATYKAIEALTEATVLLKALQRNFFLKSSVAEVRAEDAKMLQNRKPAAAEHLAPVCEPTK